MKHILVVEDEQHLAIGIKYNLEAEGYMVTTIGDGPSAMSFIEANPGAVDLIVLDLMLPGMSGYAVCESLRKAGNDVPILMLSARTLTEDRVRGFDAGTDVYLQKPFDLEELLSVVRNLLARRRRDSTSESQPEGPPSTDQKSNGVPKPAGQSRDEFRFDGDRVAVNYGTYQAKVGDELVRLTALEFKLLRYFIEHEGVVVTRNELLENVWGMSHSPTTRTVDNFIVNLRKYFEIDPARPRHFLSIRGAGYRFVAAGEDLRDDANF